MRRKIPRPHGCNPSWGYRQYIDSDPPSWVSLAVAEQAHPLSKYWCARTSANSFSLIPTDSTNLILSECTEHSGDIYCFGRGHTRSN